MANHHRHVHHKEGEPKSKLRNLAEPIILIVILVYAAQWAVRFLPRSNPANLTAGIVIAGAAALLWTLNPRKDR